MFKRIISLIIALSFSISLFTINVNAFEFEGEERTPQQAFKDWLQAQKDFINATDKNEADEAWGTANSQFITDLIALGYESGHDLAFFVPDLLTDGKCSDAEKDILCDVAEFCGLKDPKTAFEDWYQETFGSEYGKQEDTSGIDWNCGQYVLFYHSADGGWRYRMFINYSGSSIPVYHQASSESDYFLGSSMGLFDYRTYSSYLTSDYNWTDWVDGGWYYNTSTSASFVISGSGGGVRNAVIVDYTNLPLNYNGEVLPEFGDNTLVGGREGDGSPVLSPTDYTDLLDAILQALEDNKPDMSTTEKALTNIYNKIVNMTNKLHSDLSKVIDYLKKILDKLIEFFNKFIDNFDNFFDRLGEFFQSVFVPQDDYIYSSIQDIQDEISLKFAFTDSLKSIIVKCFDVYKAGGTKAPTVTFHIKGLGFINSVISHTIDLSDWDDYVKPIRSMVCVITYVTFAWNTYRRIPAYVSGVGEQ